MGSDINPSKKNTTALRDLFSVFFFAMGTLEILACRQVTIEHTATLITLLVDREMQLRPWEGNYSQNV